MSLQEASWPTQYLQLLFCSLCSHIVVKNIIVYSFLSLLREMKITYHNQKCSSPHVTTRMMKRANIIIETVRSARVIDDASKLQKMIVQVRNPIEICLSLTKLFFAFDSCCFTCMLVWNTVITQPLLQFTSTG